MPAGSDVKLEEIKPFFEKKIREDCKNFEENDRSVSIFLDISNTHELSLHCNLFDSFDLFFRNVALLNKCFSKFSVSLP